MSGNLVRFEGGERVVEEAPELSQDEIDAQQAGASRMAKITVLIEGAATIVNAIEGGQLDFGTAGRNAAVKGLAQAVRFLAKGELPE